MTEPAETNEAQNPLTKPKFIISAVVVALLVALGIIFALTPKGTETIASPAGTSAPATTGGPVNAPAEPSVCGLPDGDQSKPVTPPSNTKWELVGKFAVPTSPQGFGPGNTTEDGVRTCFAHSPNGALYAGVNMITLGSSGRGDLLAKYLIADGPERDKMLREETAAPPQTSETAAFQVSGFKIVDYSNNRAVVEYGLTTANGSSGSVSVVMQWQNGDWKWVVPPAGQSQVQQLSDLSGFIPWAGV